MSNRFSCTFTAAPEHIDAMGHVNNAVWVQWMEAIATAHWQAEALPEHKARYAWVVPGTRSTTAETSARARA